MRISARRSVAAGAAAALVLISAIVIAVPSVDDFSLENPLWNGMSAAASSLSISEAAGAIDPASTALLIVGPDLPFSPEDASRIRSYLESGGIVVLMDDFGEGNSLLEGLGVGARINGSMLLDPLFMQSSRYCPVASSDHAPASHAPPTGSGSPYSRVTLDYASVVDLEGGGKVLIWSSPFSYLDLDSDGSYTAGEPTGPFPVAVELGLGRGRLVVVSDSSLLINSLLASDCNAEFIESITAGRELYVDRSNSASSAYSSVRSVLLGAVQSVEYPEVRYAAALFGALIAFRLIGTRASPFRMMGGSRPGEGGTGAGELASTIESHPDWDREELARLWRELSALGRRSPAQDGNQAEGKTR
ncbi:MAG: hypothetical protein H5T32_07445 [Candidatus Methanosuratus sp.]|nr:hypothetical protein [Candidatus Methanosuratincola sp.]